MATGTEIPSTMFAWQYSNANGGLEMHLKINRAAPVPQSKPYQHLIKVAAVALNPVDYKPAEIPYLGSLIRSRLATPGIDYSGIIIKPATGSDLKPGQRVFGGAGSSPIAGGALAEYALSSVDSTAAIPEGVSFLDAATIAVAGLTAYQSIVPRVKRGDYVFINGGSGGTGVFGIQIAKAVGCHVTTTCSTANVALCKKLGADEVIDYKQGNVVESLIATGIKFDHGIDNVASDKQVFWRSHEFMKPGATLVIVGGEPSWDGLIDTVKRKVLPVSLGGIKGKTEGFFPSRKPEDIAQIIAWMQEGKLKSVIDQRFAFEDAPKAFDKLKTGRAKGKIVVDVEGAL